MDGVPRKCKFMSNVRREPQGSVFASSSSGAIGRAVLYRLEGRCSKDSRLVDSNRCDCPTRRRQPYFLGRFAERVGLGFVLGVFESVQENSSSSQCFLLDLSCSSIINTT